MKILIRADASTSIGSGHVMRCLTIACNFRADGHEVIFWMLPLQGNLIKYVQQQGFAVIQSMQQSDVLIVDHYELDIQWEAKMRTYCKKIIVIDDLANRRHDCDAILDQNVIQNYDSRYDHLVPSHCKKLLGPAYLLLRDEFINARINLDRTVNVAERLLVFMGGSDPTRETLKIIDALENSNHSFGHIDIVVGDSNPNKYEIQEKCNRLDFSFHCQINYMAELIHKADVAIGTGGSALWERCYLGLPSYSVIVAENQVESTLMAEELDVTINLGWHEQVTIQNYIDIMQKATSNLPKLQQISNKALELTDNQGETKLWFKYLTELLYN